MTTYFMMCSCGDTTFVRARTRPEAVSLVERMWGEREIKKHMGDMHPEEPLPPVAKVHKLFQSKLIPAYDALRNVAFL